MLPRNSPTPMVDGIALDDYEAQLGFGVGQACNHPMYNQTMNEQQCLSNWQQQCSPNLSNQQFEGSDGVDSVNYGRPRPEASMFFQQLHQSSLRSSYAAAQAQSNTLQHDQHLRGPVNPVSKFEICPKLVTKYLRHQNTRPEDNNLEYWRMFVAQYFTPYAKKKWCVALYGKEQQTVRSTSQDECLCKLCNHKSTRSFEATYEILPRLFKVKYDSGILDEHVYLDVPEQRYYHSGGQTVLTYSNVVQHTVFKQFHVARYGQLRVVLSRGLKICSWEFCAERHEEVVPRSLLERPVASIIQECQALTKNTNLSISELQRKGVKLVKLTKAIAKDMEDPILNEFGYSKSYVNCLQTADVVDSMKDMMDITISPGVGPMKRLDMFNWRMNSWSGRGQNAANEGNNYQSSSSRSHGDAGASQDITSTSNKRRKRLIPTSHGMNGRAEMGRDEDAAN